MRNNPQGQNRKKSTVAVKNSSKSNSGIGMQLQQNTNIAFNPTPNNTNNNSRDDQLHRYAEILCDFIGVINQGIRYRDIV